MFSFIILHNSEVFLYTLCVPITRRLVLRALEAGECLCAFIQFQINAEKCKLFLLWYIMILRTKGILSTMVHGLLRISWYHDIIEGLKTEEIDFQPFFITYLFHVLSLKASLLKFLRLFPCHSLSDLLKLFHRNIYCFCNFTSTKKLPFHK